MSNASVANAFANQREAKALNFRSVNQGDLTFAISWTTPIACTNGRDTLATIETYSTTTSKQQGMLYASPGITAPTTERMLRAIQAGTMTFDEAYEIGKAALVAAGERVKAQGALVTKVSPGAYRVVGSGHIIEKRDGWVIVTLSEYGVGSSQPYRTLKAARIAALDLNDVPRPRFNYHDATLADLEQVNA